MSVIAYSYNADHHCESCMLDYARKVEYKDYDFGSVYSDEDIQHSPGIIDLSVAVELGIIRDGENNEIHPVFGYQEWYNPGEGNQTLACGDCGKELATHEEE